MRRHTQLSWANGILVAAVMSGLLSSTAWSRGTNENVLSPTLTEAQQEENDVQAMEAKYLAKEKADDKAELISFDKVKKMSKAARHKRPLWGKRKWPSYYHNVLGNSDVFLADEPNHSVRNLDIGDDDSAIESKERVRGPSNRRRRRNHSRGGHSNRTPEDNHHGRVHRETKSAPTQDLAELPSSEFSITVPAGVEPGRMIMAEVPGHGPVLLRVPPGSAPGQTLHFSPPPARPLAPPPSPWPSLRGLQPAAADVPAPQSRAAARAAGGRAAGGRFEVRVPAEGAAAGRVEADVPGFGRILIAVPPGTAPGQELAFTLPSSIHPLAATAPPRAVAPTPPPLAAASLPAPSAVSPALAVMVPAVPVPTASAVAAPGPPARTGEAKRAEPAAAVLAEAVAVKARAAAVQQVLPSHGRPYVAVKARAASAAAGDSGAGGGAPGGGTAGGGTAWVAIPYPAERYADLVKEQQLVARGVEQATRALGAESERTGRALVGIVQGQTARAEQRVGAAAVKAEDAVAAEAAAAERRLSREEEAAAAAGQARVASAAAAMAKGLRREAAEVARAATVAAAARAEFAEDLATIRKQMPRPSESSEQDLKARIDSAVTKMDARETAAERSERRYGEAEAAALGRLREKVQFGEAAGEHRLAEEVSRVDAALAALKALEARETAGSRDSDGNSAAVTDDSAAALRKLLAREAAARRAAARRAKDLSRINALQRKAAVSQLAAVDAAARARILAQRRAAAVKEARADATAEGKALRALRVEGRVSAEVAALHKAEAADRLRIQTVARRAAAAQAAVARGETAAAAAARKSAEAAAQAAAAAKGEVAGVERRLERRVLRLAAAVVADRAAAARRRRRHGAELEAEVRARAEEERLLQAEEAEVAALRVRVRQLALARSPPPPGPAASPSRRPPPPASALASAPPSALPVAAAAGISVGGAALRGGRGRVEALAEGGGARGGREPAHAYEARVLGWRHRDAAPHAAPHAATHAATSSKGGGLLGAVGSWFAKW